MDKTFLINGKKAPLLLRLVLIFILIICAIIPIATSIFIIENEIESKFGLVFSFILFWGIGYYLIRLILWNTYGQEILTLSNNRISYLADYKYFKDGKQEIEISNLICEIIYVNQTDKKTGRLRLKNNAEIIETVLQSNINEIEQIEKEIKRATTKAHMQ
jgi:hypothetical protein